MADQLYVTDDERGLLPAMSSYKLRDTLLGAQLGAARLLGGQGLVEKTLERAARSNSPFTRLSALNRGYDPNRLLHDKSPMVRLNAFLVSEDPSFLAVDKDPRNRLFCAQHGIGLDALVDDPDSQVSLAARVNINMQDKTVDEWIEDNPERCFLPENRNRIDLVARDLSHMSRDYMNTEFFFPCHAIKYGMDLYNEKTGELFMPDINSDGRFFGFNTYRVSNEEISAAAEQGLDIGEYVRQTVPAPALASSRSMGFMPFTGVNALYVRFKDVKPGNWEVVGAGYVAPPIDNRNPEHLKALAKSASDLAKDQPGDLKQGIHHGMSAR